MATIGTQFDFKVFSRRKAADDTYKITLTRTGWDVKCAAASGACDKEGNPSLYRSFSHDSIQYPSGIRSAFSFLYTNQVKLTNEELQAELSRLAEWVSSTERGTPIGNALADLW